MQERHTREHIVHLADPLVSRVVKIKKVRGLHAPANVHGEHLQGVSKPRCGELSTRRKESEVKNDFEVARGVWCRGQNLETINHGAYDHNPLLILP